MSTDTAREDGFPESSRTSWGMIDLETDHVPRHGSAHLNIVYAAKSERDLHVHVLAPPAAQASSERYPLVAFVPGSGWMQQDLDRMVPAMSDFTRRGYVVALIEYRPSSVSPFPAQVRDVASAIRFLRRHAHQLQADPKKMLLWGDSSGGHTALMLYAAGEDQRFNDEPVGPEPLGLRGVVDFYGPGDLARMVDEPSAVDHAGADSPEGMVLGGVPVAESPVLHEATVMSHVDSATRRPPLLIMHGSRDPIVPFGQSVDLYEALQAAGQEATFYRLRGAGHGGPPFWQPAVFDLVDAFMRGALDRPAT